MKIATTRFGLVEIEPNDILHFPQGLMAFEDCRHWVLLADADNPSVGWLQSVTRPEIALAVVSPRRFVPDYQVQLPAGDMTPLRVGQEDRVYVLSIVSRHDRAMTLNLKAPLIVNLDRLTGRQVIVVDDQPLQYELAEAPAVLRKSA